MRFQPIKCNMMKLTRKKKHHIDFEYQLEGSKLEFVDNIKYLGVHIANDLRWNTVFGGINYSVTDTIISKQTYI
jgi:hypothetical protein